MYYNCQHCEKKFLSKKTLDAHEKDCVDNFDETETVAESDAFSVTSSAVSYNLDKLISDKNALRDELKILLNKYESKKLESRNLRQQLDDAMAKQKKFEEETRIRYSQIADEIQGKRDAMKEKESRLKSKEDMLRSREDALNEREQKTREKEERFLYQEKAVVEREDRIREFEAKLKQREDRVFHSENRIRELEEKLDSVNTEHRQLLMAIEREKAQIAMHMSNISNEKESVRLHTIKIKDDELQAKLGEKDSVIVSLRLDVESMQKKLAKMVDQNDKINMETKVDYEMQLQKMRSDFARVKSDFERRLAERTHYHSDSVALAETKLKDEVQRVSADYETKMKQQSDNYQKIIDTLQVEYNKKNKEFNENMINLRSDIEFYKKSLAESISKKETEVKADASIKLIELKMDYENQLKMYEQEKKAVAFDQQMKQREYEEKASNLSQSLEESKNKIIHMDKSFREMCKKYDEKLSETILLGEKKVQQQEEELKFVRDEMAMLRKDTDVRVLSIKNAHDELLKTLTKERSERESLLSARDEMKASYEQKLSTYRYQAENERDRAANKIEEARLQLEKEYREQLTSLEIETRELKAKYGLDTAALKEKIDRLNVELKSAENVAKEARDKEVKELKLRHADELSALMKKHEVEIGYLRTDLGHAKAQLEHSQKTYEKTLTAKLNDEKSQILQSFSEEIERVNTALHRTQQEYYEFKKSSVDVLNNVRTTLQDDKRRELRELEMKYTLQIEKLSDSHAKDRNEYFSELEKIKQTKETELVEKIKSAHQKEIAEITTRAEKEIAKLREQKQELENKFFSLQEETAGLRIQFDADVANMRREHELKLNEKDESFMNRLKDETGKLRKQNQETTSKYTFEIKQLLQEIELITQSKKIELNELRNLLENTELEIERIRKTLEEHKMQHTETVKRLTADKEKLAIENRQKELLEEKLKVKEEQMKSLFDKIGVLSEENMLLKTQKHQEITNIQKEKMLSVSEKEHEIKILEETWKKKLADEIELQKLAYEETISQLLKKNQLEHIKLDHDKRIASLTENFNLEKRALAENISASFITQINDLKEKLSIIDISRKEAVLRLEECTADKNIYLNESQILKTKLLEMESLKKVVLDQKNQIDKLTLTCDKLTELNEQYISQKAEAVHKFDQIATLNEILKKQIKLTANKDEYKKTVDKLMVENLRLKQAVEQLSKK